MKKFNILIIVVLIFFLIFLKIFKKTPSVDILPEQESTTNSNTTFLWRENKFDEFLNETKSDILINEEFCSTITDYEKAALCYVATFNGNEYNWTTDTIEKRGFIKSRILASLNLGDECSEAHLGFLKYMFRRDSKVMGEINSFKCGALPDIDLDVQESFENISIIRDDDKIQIIFKMMVINSKDGKRWEWTESDLFQISKGKIKLVKKINSRDKI
jgi:hypothetical protein